MTTFGARIVGRRGGAYGLKPLKILGGRAFSLFQENIEAGLSHGRRAGSGGLASRLRDGGRRDRPLRRICKKEGAGSGARLARRLVTGGGTSVRAGGISARIGGLDRMGGVLIIRIRRPALAGRRRLVLGDERKLREGE